MKALIVGGGIGGLATALCLHDAGIDSVVYERSERIGELGVGINVLPHAAKVLVELDLLDRLDDVAVRTHELIYMNRFGQQIWRELRGVDAGYDVPQFSIHRGRLQRVLYDAVRERLGGDAVQAGHRFVHFQQDADGVTATFANGDRAVELAGDVLIGADGIHSAVRSQMFRDEGPPTWNGVMMWRGAVEWPSFLTGRSMIIAGGMRAKLVLYPIAAGTSAGTRLTNWVVLAKTGRDNDPLPRREDWSRQADRMELVPRLGSFAMPHVDVAGLVAATPEIYEYPMCDRDPLPFWSRGRVTLLGDAAHPMYPVGSNGAGQAIIDATTIACCLQEEARPEVALQAYEAERLPVTAEIVRMNRMGGPERAIDEVEDRAPEGFERLDDVISQQELHDIVTGFANTAGFTRDHVNATSNGHDDP